MKKIINLVILLLIFQNIKAQETYVPLFKINAEADFFSVDALGNIFLVNGPEILKLDEKGVFLSKFSKRDYGNITSLDTRDPLRLLVFYKSFGIMRTLENKLSEQSVIDLRTLEVKDPTLICSA